jgi:hypothetical protein
MKAMEAAVMRAGWSTCPVKIPMPIAPIACRFPQV